MVSLPQISVFAFFNKITLFRKNKTYTNMQHNTYKAEPGVQGGIAPTVPPKIRPVPSLLLYNNNPKILILVIDSQ